MKRIGHIMPGPGVGGVEMATARVARILPPDLYQNVVFCVGGKAPVTEFFRSAGFDTVEYSPPVPALRPANLAAFVRASWNFAGLLKKHRIDIVHCSDLQAGWFVALGARLARRRVVCHIRNRFSDIDRRTSSVLRLVNDFAFVSRDTWKRFGMAVGSRHGRVIYDGFDPPSIDADDAKREVRREFGILPEQKIVGMSARIAAQKDHETLVRAAPAILAACPEVRFLMVGDHSGFPEYQAHYTLVRGLIRDLGVGHAFIFTDHRPDAVRLTAAMDVFVLSTHFEGLPLVLLEAMSLGCPTVATDVDGIPEVISDGETGFLVPHQDSAILADRIIRVLSEPDLAASLSARARSHVAARFNNDQFCAGLRAIYDGRPAPHL